MSAQRPEGRPFDAPGRPKRESSLGEAVAKRPEGRPFDAPGRPKRESSPGPLVPGSWLGVLGGGQLGRMFCQAAQAMGYRVAVLDPDPDSPAGTIADWHLAAGYDDADALRAFAERCPAVTTEFENVPAASLEALAQWSRVAPGARQVAVAQDRLVEKATLRGLGVAVVPYTEVRSVADLDAAPETHFPGILKLARLGYDGKGQARVASREEARAAFAQLGGKPCVLEAFMADLRLEVSVVVARQADGSMQCFPTAHNEHREGILFHCAVPVAADPAIDAALAEAQASARRIADGLGYEGVMCVEFFIDGSGGLRVNEIAPRPHNSGHYTIDACSVSQFEQQARVLAGLPLGQPELLAPAVMINILGDQWFDALGQPREPDWAAVLAVPGTRLHLYGKAEPRRGRKMGHVTCVAADAETVRQRAREALQALRMEWDRPW
ncbi:MAG: 5-(carboxyamino)imidazole ribonucleotide synthase [Pigmentiphaga sp.]|nr:5-(carboxyamino)imidazole ribonucleotide synthase [Pigmentiphaga sp.]